jgi:hypothetical protein
MWDRGRWPSAGTAPAHARAPFSVSLIHSPAVLWGRAGRVPEREGGKNSQDLSHHLIVHSGPEPTGDPYLFIGMQAQNVPACHPIIIVM